MKSIAIKHLDGSVLWSGDAKTMRQAVLNAVKEGRSLEGADLRGLNLSRMDLSYANMKGACLDGADLRGTILKNANLMNASLIQVRAEGCMLDFASLVNSYIKDSFFNGSNLVFVDMRQSTIIDTLFTCSAMSSARMSDCIIHKSGFKECQLQNASLNNSIVTECDFSDANIEHRAFSSLSKEEHQRLSAYLPNRTLGAKIVGCTYNKGTILADTVPAMEADRRSTNVAKYGLWACSTLGIVTGVEKTVEAIGELGHQVGGEHMMAGGIIVVLALATLLKEKVVENLRDPAEKWLSHITNKTREYIRSINEENLKKWDLVCLIGHNHSLNPIKMALNAKQEKAKERGFLSTFKSIVINTEEIVLCDRRHLAMALSFLCEAREEGFKIKENITLLHCDTAHQDNSMPCVLHMNVDGTTSTTWYIKDNKNITIVYGKDGLPISAHDEKRKPVDLPTKDLPEYYNNKISVLMAFESALLEKYGLHNFKYDNENYRLEEGRKGAILVKKRSNGRLGNDVGYPAIIPINEDPIYLRNGSVVAP